MEIKGQLRELRINKQNWRINIELMIISEIDI